MLALCYLLPATCRGDTAACTNAPTIGLRPSRDDIGCAARARVVTIQCHVLERFLSLVLQTAGVRILYGAEFLCAAPATLVSRHARARQLGGSAKR